MKTAFYLICTSFLATGIYMVALHSKNSVPGIALALGLRALFFWGWGKRRKRAAQQREREQLWENFLRRQRDHNRFM
jgi:hypothetical protein